MRALAIVAFACVIAACGGANDSGNGSGEVAFDLYVSAAGLSDVGGFQLALVKASAFNGCGAYTATTCLSSQVSRADLAEFEDEGGHKIVTLFVPNEIGTGTTQDTTLRNVPTGKNYVLIVEALSRDATPKLLGTSCTQKVEIRSGNNERVQAQPIVFLSSGGDAGMGTDAGTSGGCDPRIP